MDSRYTEYVLNTWPQCYRQGLPGRQWYRVLVFTYIDWTCLTWTRSYRRRDSLDGNGSTSLCSHADRRGGRAGTGVRAYGQTDVRADHDRRTCDLAGWISVYHWCQLGSIVRTRVCVGEPEGACRTSMRK